jgi:hypothetical protein
VLHAVRPFLNRRATGPKLTRYLGALCPGRSGGNAHLYFNRVTAKVGSNGVIVFEKTAALLLVMPWSGNFCRLSEKQFAAAKMLAPQIERAAMVR